jgi:hypothetical protein
MNRFVRERLEKIKAHALYWEEEAVQKRDRTLERLHREVRMEVEARLKSAGARPARRKT